MNSAVIASDEAWIFPGECDARSAVPTGQHTDVICNLLWGDAGVGKIGSVGVEALLDFVATGIICVS